jgi:hypothetical protein
MYMTTAAETGPIDNCNKRERWAVQEFLLFLNESGMYNDVMLLLCRSVIDEIVSMQRFVSDHG